jgi:exodeoxyribonuclease-3
LKIATFNINYVNRRLPSLQAWLGATKPDVVHLQEFKCAGAAFPIDALRKTGYGAVWKGKRT